MTLRYFTYTNEHQKSMLKKIQNHVLQNEVNNPRWKVRNAGRMERMERVNVEEINRNVHCIAITNGYTP